MEGANDDSTYPHFPDLWVVFPIALLCFALRKFLFESIIARNLGIHFGLKQGGTKAPLPRHPALVAAFEKSPRKYPEGLFLIALMSKTDLSELKLQHWWRNEQKSRKPTTLVKFEEGFFRLCFYTISFLVGAYIAYSTPFFWDTELLWINQPFHHISGLQFWYYAIELGLYLMLLITQFTDVRRKDFIEMFIHHIVTIGLVVGSFLGNQIRIGSLVFMYHDFADIFLELAKLLKYLGDAQAVRRTIKGDVIMNQWNAMSNYVFVVFALSFIGSRLGFFPYHLIYSSYLEGPLFIEVTDFTAAIALRRLMCALVLLHIMWTYTILKMAATQAAHGDFGEDARSDDDGDDETTPERTKTS